MKKLLTALFTAAAITTASWAPAASAAEVKEVTQQQHGLTLNANLLMADGKGFSDEMVLLTHGTLTHKERSTYAALQKNLAAQGVSSLSINLSLGLDNRHGEYDCAVPHTHKHTDALQEIGYWMDWLKQQGTEKVVLMGHSRGGNQTAWYAAEHDSDMIDKVILIAPATGAQQSADEYAQKAGTSLQPILDKAQKLVAEGKGDQMLDKTYFIYCKDAQVTAAAFADYYTVKPQFDTPTLLQNPHKPTLVVMGSDDDVVPDLPQAIKPLVEAGKVSSVTVEDAGHFFMDFANEDLATAAAEFIAE
ncbi:alpha/beta hydrolase [Thiomicrorhabdus sp. 6S3-12]|uniref:alpha/beta hydrolase n=1 Tax=Thiomicrorhabdus sp. 6S3-12 TaxID=2819681 RepID=UPI001AAD8911|nr:alpha/beta hydrolase [Thiomicrorhabdus sp. 6S3-12]MBO1924824.1 alpha/beta hydrolase [Thiomicrorhabdus sp. 6S3-12]